MRCRISNVMLCCLLAACTPQTAVMMALLPDGTVPVMLSHLEQVDESNRRRVEDLEGRGDWAGLARFAEAHLAQDQSNADWWLVAGYAYTRQGNPVRAAGCYGEAVRLVPDDITSWNLLAQSQRAAGKPEQAIKTLDQALLVRRDSPVTLYLLGESYSDMRRWQSAAGAYAEALKLNDRFAEAWFGMGRAYLRLGRPEEARQIVPLLKPLNSRLAAELAGALPQPPMHP